MPENRRHLYLIPSPIGNTEVVQVIPAYNLGIIQELRHFVVEEEKTARRFLVRCGYKHILNTAEFYTLNEHTGIDEIPEIFTHSKPYDLGLLSEAGLPAVADPGAMLVKEAHKLNIQVIPLTGPSSLMLALMASGLNGQHFAFNGYLPVKPSERNAKIRFYEKRSATEKQSQLFIEAPYRNHQLLAALLEQCRPDTQLCIAVNISLSEEWIETKAIREWKMHTLPNLHRKPAVFILQAQ